MVIPKAPKAAPKAQVLKFPPSNSKCVPYGVFIMKELKKGVSLERLSYLVGINVPTIKVYVRKVLDYNEINERMLKFYEIE